MNQDIDIESLQEKQLNPKKQEEYNRERISANSPHHCRHGHSESKRHRNGYERTRIRYVVHLNFINDNLEELSAPLLKTI